MFEQPWGQSFAGEGEEDLGLGGGVVEGPIIIAAAFALSIVPMGHSMERRIFLGPSPEFALQLRREILVSNTGVVAMLTNQAGIQNVASEKGQ